MPRCLPVNFVGGLGGADITLQQVRDIFACLRDFDAEGGERVRFLGVDG